MVKAEKESDGAGRVQAVVERAKSALEGVTEGPWIAEYSSEQGNCIIPHDAESTREAVATTHLYHQRADAEFIAQARTLVPELVAEIEELRLMAAVSKKKKYITVKVIPMILTPEEVRQKIVDVISDWAPVYSDDAEQVAAEILSGVTLVQVRDVEEKAQARVWDSIHAVPLGVKVRDRECDVFWWDENYALWWTSHWWSDLYQGKIGADFNSTFGPFTEVIE
ncbi:hypothetical protein Gompeii16_39 [Mycobacterium phage Gompeii16]|uniref:hypothetical protein n=1 Tax=Mycobacterium phage Gompeii16 TaxID=1873895 RepID=UPI000810FC75|nr:hypothetical protein Gompeii16_39 [Mycobacterium phage Gompeii16]ANU79458.1 hypothetical protein Gompeii16_39 [Mycobacterium phage Gompeii16]ANU79547.1 hypothetical protein SEA_BIRCSAK_39 [Mycobacterium phage Bircsak]